jgi:hypothetical protein
LLILAGCRPEEKTPEVEVSEVWVRLPATPAQPGAAYFTLKGNMEGMRLLAVTSSLVRWVELHESVEKGGVARMERRKEVEFPSRGAMEFKPGGRHAMLFGINPAVKSGTVVPLTFSFNMAPPVTVDAEVRTASGEPHAEH